MRARPARSPRAVSRIFDSAGHNNNTKSRLDCIPYYIHVILANPIQLAKSHERLGEQLWPMPDRITQISVMSWINEMWIRAKYKNTILLLELDTKFNFVTKYKCIAVILFYF